METTVTAQWALESTKNIKKNIKQVIIGKEKAIDLILITLICRGHVLIEDVPGVGKTTMVAALAKSLDCSFKRIQFTPDVLASDITGFTVPNFKTGEFEHHPGMLMSQIILADEINRTSPKTQSSLLEAMEEHQVTVDGVTYLLPQPFMVLATQNPVEYVGTFPLPEAQLDRFFVRISLGYPDLGEEIEILNRFQQQNPLQNLQPIASTEDILTLQSMAQKVYCTTEIKTYIAKIVYYTRSHPDLQLGASPRGSLYLMRAAQAHALIRGREYVLPDDVQRMASSVLIHRIIMKPESRVKGTTPEKVLQSILNELEIPMILV